MKTNLPAPKLGSKIPRRRKKTRSKRFLRQEEQSAPVFLPVTPQKAFYMGIYRRDAIAMMLTIWRFFKTKDIQAHGKEMVEQLFVEAMEYGDF